MTDTSMSMERLTWQRRWMARWLYATAVATGVILGTIAISILDRRQIVESDIIGIVPDPALAGKPASVSWHVRALREGCDGYVRRSITASDTREWQLGDAPVAPRPRGEASFVREIDIPANITPGPAVYRAEVWRWCNELQRILWPMHETLSPVYFRISGG